MDGETLIVTGNEGAGGGDAGGGGTGGGAGDDLELIVGDAPGDEGGSEGEGGGEGDGGGEGEGQGEGEGGRRQEKVDDKEEPEVKEFSGLVSGKLRNIIRQAPELGQVMAKYPEVKNLLEATMRRDAAMREIFPTVAEARALRDRFPNGNADVEALLEDVRETEELDNNFDTPDAQGNYPGHLKLIENFVSRNKDAAIAFFKTMPKEWARIDKDSYNEVMGKVVASTFASRQIPEFLQGVIEDAKAGGDENKGVVASLERLLGWVNGYFTKKPELTEAEQNLARERAELDRRKAEDAKTRGNEFHKTFLNSAKTLQVKALKEHRVIKKLESLSSLDASKKADIVEKVRQATERFLALSPSFMRKLRAAHGAGDLGKCEEIQRAAWAQPWLLNRMIRTVMHKEVPHLIQTNREATQRRAGAQRAAAPGKPGDKQRNSNAPKGPRQIGGRWYKEDGTLFTSAEILSGKHLAA